MKSFLLGITLLFIGCESTVGPESSQYPFTIDNWTVRSESNASWDPPGPQLFFIQAVNSNRIRISFDDEILFPELYSEYYMLFTLAGRAIPAPVDQLSSNELPWSGRSDIWQNLLLDRTGEPYRVRWSVEMDYSCGYNGALSDQISVDAWTEDEDLFYFEFSASGFIDTVNELMCN